MPCSSAWYVLPVSESLSVRRLNYISSVALSVSACLSEPLTAICSVHVCVCVCVKKVRGALVQECVILIAISYLLTHDTPPACLSRWLLLSSCENQAYTNTGKTETCWSQRSSLPVDTGVCVCVSVCVRYLVLRRPSCAAYPVKSLSRSTRPSLPGRACERDEELHPFPGQVGTSLKAVQ